MTFSGDLLYVQAANVIGLFTEEQRYMVVSFICHQLKRYLEDENGTKRHQVSIEKKLYKYGCIPGANTRHERTPDEEIKYDKDKAAFTSQALYSGRCNYIEVSIAYY